MITLIDNEPIVFEGGTMKDEEFIGTDDFKNITKALELLAKSCPSFIVSAYTNDDNSALVYNHAAGRHKEGNHLYEVVKNQRGEKAAKEALRGTELATHITNILTEAKQQYGVDPEAVLETIKKGQDALSSYENLDEITKKELMDALKGCESTEEAMDIMKAKLGIDGLNKRNKSEIKGKYSELEDMFARTEDKANIDVKSLERSIHLATGAKTKAFKMSDPDCIPALAHSLSKNLHSTTIVGYAKIGEDNELVENSICVHYQDDFEKIIKGSKKDVASAKVAVAGSICCQILKDLKKQYGLPDGLFAEYLRREGI